MSDVELPSDEDIGGEILSEDENELEVIQEPGEGEVFQETENVEVQEGASGDGENAQKQEAKVKRVRNPQPKLNADRLKGPRGIHTVEGILKKIKFKGRGHEEEDLNSLMRGYEYWCHRLFPKFTFDDCLDRIERLGKKREVQTYIKRIRMNLLLSDDIDGTVRNADDDENETETNDTQNTASDPFDTQFSREEAAAAQAPANQISEEQLERMRINRERAQRIRRQKIIITAHEDLNTPVSHSQYFSDSVPLELPCSQNDSESTQNGTQLVSSTEMQVEVHHEESVLPSDHVNIPVGHQQPVDQSITDPIHDDVSTQNKQPVDQSITDSVPLELPCSQNDAERTQSGTQLESSTVIQESEMQVDVPHEESLSSSEDVSRNIAIPNIDSQN